jgi:hypothetical protein
MYTNFIPLRAELQEFCLGHLYAAHCAFCEEQIHNTQAGKEGWIPGDFANHLYVFRSSKSVRVKDE